MKHVFVDDGYPEARDFEDNYMLPAPRPAIAVQSDSNRWIERRRYFQRLENLLRRPRVIIRRPTARPA